jgi:thiosulfate/3-mercaptopyruvate sulfurtransferase
VRARFEELKKIMAMTYPYGKGGETIQWVSTEWLQQHLNDKNLTIIDCQPNIHEYIQDHIPGALYAHENLFRCHEGKIPTRWISVEAATLLFRTLGIDSERHVVAYSSSGPLTACTTFIGDGLEQTMLAYTLARFGHHKVYVLDGGFEKWKEEKRPLTREYSTAVSSNYILNLKDEFFIEYDELKKIKDKPDTVLIDARPPAFYEGQGPWLKPGHIPGAVSLPWKTLMDDKNKKLMKTPEQLEAMVKAIGATPDKTIICSCGTGREATNEFLLFKWFLGYPKVRIYEGSFTEWLLYKDNPTVTGKSPR